MDFGGLKAFKEWSEYMFDHTLVIGHDDPHLDKFKALASLGLQEVGGVCDIRIVEAVGCEKFSELAYKTMQDILETFQKGEGWELKDQSGKTLKVFGARYPVGKGVKLRSVEVFEHNANSATYEG
jgi:hypothetical protein